MYSYAITREKFLSNQEQKKLLKVCKERSDRDRREGRRTWIVRYMLVHIALNSGLRVSEIAALKIGDLHFNGTENYLIVTRGKRGKRRDVYLDQLLVKHLAEFKAIKESDWDEAIDVEAPLFSGRGGQHYTTTALEISFKKAIEAAGLSMRYSIHSSRHTYATLLLAKTGNLRFVQKQLGHANIATTSLYADVMPEQNQRLAEAILK
jgi:site-specific recombinase XerD